MIILKPISLETRSGPLGGDSYLGSQRIDESNQFMTINRLSSGLTYSSLFSIGEELYDLTQD